MKTLILKSNRDEFERYYIEKMQDKNCCTYPYYKKITLNKWVRAIAILWMQKLNLPFQSIWYGPWKKKLSNFDQVIVFDRIWGLKLLQYIHKKSPNARIIFWYWNTIDEKKNVLLSERIRKNCETWSFDINDCLKYKLKNNIQFYFFEKDIKYSSDKILYDAFFIGTDKKRFEEISNIYNLLKKCHLNVYIKIVRDKTSVKNNSSLYINEGISYTKILDLIRKSKCIIDVPQEGQSGITIRVLEAIFLNKKLITTDLNIQKYDFYNESNILIYNNQSPEEINHFLKIPYEKIDYSCLCNYTFEKWLSNFKEGN